ncbi:MAG: EAL domain-containing protein [Geminocystis sp.]|nr:EAL domain-containing protein [Geminocystis sp.]MCS7148347.1 EAL domain-containing protein [Geminocystis sp.]MDW8116065.1 EAL domain-containing protein [Geminocystis sp.]MDW8463594.1 EAL domain-containing protein [Geminocystis sp.]
MSVATVTDYKNRVLELERILEELRLKYSDDRFLLSVFHCLNRDNDILEFLRHACELVVNEYDLDLCYFSYGLAEGKRLYIFSHSGHWQETEGIFISIDKGLKTLVHLWNNIPNNSNYVLDYESEIIGRLGLFYKFPLGVNFLFYTEGKTSGDVNILGFYSRDIRNINERVIENISRLVKIVQLEIDKLVERQIFTLCQKAIEQDNIGVIITDAGPPYSLVWCNEKGKKFSHSLTNQYRQLIESTGGECVRRIVEVDLDGSQGWNEVKIFPISLQDIRRLVLLIYDYTEEYLLKENFLRQKEELQAVNAQLNLISQLNQMREYSLREILEFYFEKIADICHFDLIILSEVLGQKCNIIAGYSRDSQKEFSPRVQCFLSYFTAKAIANKRMISSLEEANKDIFLESKILDLPGGVYWGFPIEINGEYAMVLHLFCLKSRPNFEIQNSLLDSVVNTVKHIVVSEERELENEQISIALRESRERLNSIIESLDDVIWSIHPQTLQIIYINQAAEKLFHVPLSRIFQKRTYWLDLVSPKEREKVKEMYANLFSTSLLGGGEKSHDIEYEIILEDGTRKYVRDRATVIYDNEGKELRIDGIITDITTRRNAQKALEKSEEEFRLIFELAPTGMMITNLDGQIIQVNNSLCELLRYPSEELLSKNELSICHPEDKEKCHLYKHKIITECLEQYRQERRFLASNGCVIHTRVNITALRNKEGRIIQFIQQILDISDIKIMEQQMFYDAFYDKLTGLPNRFLLLDRIKQFLKLNKEDPQQFCAVLLVDVDNFKKVNDSFGHTLGDELLTLIADNLVRCVAGKDTVARFSGDEFIVFLPDINSEKEVEYVAQKIVSNCFVDAEFEGQRVMSTVSVGITTSYSGHETAEEMIRDADIAVHHAKEKGGNCYQIFKPAMHKDLLKRLTLESSLLRGLENGEFELYYQPIVNLQTGRIAGFEALIRWHNPTHGFVSPMDFIPIAEETGLIVTLGNWIFSEAAKQAFLWQSEYPHYGLFVSINVSGKQLFHPHLLEEIDLIINSTGVDPRLLKLEITESVLVKDYEHAKAVLEEIQARKLQICLDDFGTGYSSLSYLHHLPFNCLKIDKGFIQPLSHPSSSNPIVEAIVNLAHNLSLEVIAEGIETETQQEILKRIRCHYGQGYLYSPPVGATKAGELIRKGQLTN